MRNTIKSNAEISFIFTNGKRFSIPGITFIVSKTNQHGQDGRVAFIAGKKKGNAVWRNAAKRRMRALAQELDSPWQDFDVIFLAKRNVLQVSYEKLVKEGKRTVALFLYERGIEENT